MTSPSPSSPRSFIFETRIERARQLREEGTAKFRAGDIQEALSLYERALYHVDFDELVYNFELQDEHRVLVDGERVPLWVNCSTALLRLDRIDDALEKVELAIKQDGKHVKALFRRAQIRRKMKDLDRAVKDLETVLKLEPDNVEANKEMMSLRREWQEQNVKAQETWKGKLATTPAITTATALPQPSPDDGITISKCLSTIRSCFHRLCGRGGTRQQLTSKVQ